MRALGVVGLGLILLVVGVAVVGLVAGRSLPKPPLGAVTSPGPTGAAGGSATPGGGALVAACRADKASVQSAAEAYVALNGTPPPDVAALVPSFLAEPPSGQGYRITLVTGTTTAASSLPGC